MKAKTWSWVRANSSIVKYLVRWSEKIARVRLLYFECGHVSLYLCLKVLVVRPTFTVQGIHTSRTRIVTSSCWRDPAVDLIG